MYRLADKLLEQLKKLIKEIFDQSEYRLGKKPINI